VRTRFSVNHKPQLNPTLAIQCLNLSFCKDSAAIAFAQFLFSALDSLARGSTEVFRLNWLQTYLQSHFF